MGRIGENMQELMQLVIDPWSLRQNTPEEQAGIEAAQQMGFISRAYIAPAEFLSPVPVFTSQETERIKRTAEEIAQRYLGGMAVENGDV